jgi:hypothetical protein
MKIELSDQLHEDNAGNESGYQRAHASFTAQFGEDDSKTLLIAFVEAMEQILTEIDTHVFHRDGVLLSRLTHRVIGMCPMYLATETADMARSIEIELKLGDWAKVENLCVLLRTSFQKYLGE